MLNAALNVATIILAFLWDKALGGHVTQQQVEDFLAADQGSKREVV
jgi:hypothetical protein